MIARLLIGLSLLVCLGSAGQAQEQSIGYMMRLEGFAVEADSLGSVVTLRLSPGWAKILSRPVGQEERKALARLLGAFVDTGIPTERPLRSYSTGLLLATMEQARGQSSLQIELEFEPDASSRLQMTRSFEQLAEVLESSTEKPRALKLAVRFEPRAESVERSAFKEKGSEIFLVLPAKTGWSQPVVEQILRSRSI